MTFQGKYIYEFKPDYAALEPATEPILAPETANREDWMTVGEAVIHQDLWNRTELILAVIAQGETYATERANLAAQCESLQAQSIAMKRDTLISRRKAPELVITALCLLLAGFSLSILVFTPLESLAIFGLVAASAGFLPGVSSLLRRDHNA